MRYTMEDFMIEAPKIARQNVENRKELTKQFVEIFNSGKYERITMVACGSSYNIANNAKYFMQKFLRMPVSIIWSETFLLYDLDLVDSKTFVIFMSQSGHSTNTIAAAKLLKERGIDAIALTNFPDSPIREHVKAAIPYGSTLNDLFVAKGFIISTLFLMLASLEVSAFQKKITNKEYEYTIRQISKAIEKLDESRKLGEEFYFNHKTLCQEMYRTIVVGCGPTYATGLEGCLKLTENYGCASTAFEVDEFYHGPDIEVTKDVTVIYVDGANESPIHSRILQSYEGVKHLTDRRIILTHDESVSGDYVIRFKDEGIEDYIAVLYLVCPFQYWAHKITEELRCQAWTRNVFAYGKVMKTKVPGVRY